MPIDWAKKIKKKKFRDKNKEGDINQEHIFP